MGPVEYSMKISLARVASKVSVKIPLASEAKVLSKVSLLSVGLIEVSVGRRRVSSKVALASEGVIEDLDEDFAGQWKFH
eukprot:gene10530-biopygen3211